jgi:hypothetical protein
MQGYVDIGVNGLSLSQSPSKNVDQSPKSRPSGLGQSEPFAPTEQRLCSPALGGTDLGTVISDILRVVAPRERSRWSSRCALVARLSCGKPAAPRTLISKTRRHSCLVRRAVRLVVKQRRNLGVGVTL